MVANSATVAATTSARPNRLAIAITAWEGGKRLKLISSITRRDRRVVKNTAHWKIRPLCSVKKWTTAKRRRTVEGAARGWRVLFRVSHGPKLRMLVSTIVFLGGLPIDAGIAMWIAPPL
jgi:hypothetical protein